jgi:hypothetical protein
MMRPVCACVYGAFTLLPTNFPRFGEVLVAPFSIGFDELRTCYHLENCMLRALVYA